jgi:hypothetical protein
MYSRYFPFVTAQARLTCSSMRKCGQTGMSKASTACAILSQGVIPPMRGHVDLHDRARSSRYMFAEVPDRVYRLRIRDRRPGRPRKPDMAVAIVRWQRGSIVGAQPRARGGRSPVVLGCARSADLDLRAHETLFARRDRVIDQRLLVDMQPTTFGCVERPVVRSAARTIQRGSSRRLQRRSRAQCRSPRAPARDRPDRRRMGEFELAPDRFDPLRLSADNGFDPLDPRHF